MGVRFCILVNKTSCANLISTAIYMKKKKCVQVDCQINKSQKDDMAANTTLSTITQVKNLNKEGDHLTELIIVQATLKVYVLCRALKFSQGSFFHTVTIICSLENIWKMHKNTKK